MSGPGLLHELTVFCTANSRMLKVKTVLVQWLLVPTCSIFGVVCGCSLILTDLG